MSLVMTTRCHYWKGEYIKGVGVSGGGVGMSGGGVGIPSIIVNLPELTPSALLLVALLMAW